MSDKKKPQNCFSLYFRDSFVAWAKCTYFSLRLSDIELINIAKQMWTDMCNERELNDGKGVKDGESFIKFSTTSSVQEGSRNYGRFVSEKSQILEYMKKNASKYIDKYSSIYESSPSQETEIQNSPQSLRIKAWNGLNKLSSEDFEENYYFESEEMLVTAIQLKYQQSIKTGDVLVFENLMNHISKQISELNVFIHDTNKSISILEDKIKKKKKQFEELILLKESYIKADSFSRSLHLKIQSSSTLKRKRFDNYNLDNLEEFCEEAMNLNPNENNTIDVNNKGELNDVISNIIED